MKKPFEPIEETLAKIMELLQELKQTRTVNILDANCPDFKYVPIQEIFKRGICSKPKFYEHFHAGDYPLYKFGNKSFVNIDEFLSAFKKIDMSKASS